MSSAATVTTPPCPWRGELWRDHPLARYTTWRVGGAARRCYRPVDADDLSHFLAQHSAEEPLCWLGLGSNVLIRDGGINATVILTHGALVQSLRLDELTLRVEAGLPCAKVARLAARYALSGVEFLVGIPGTLGGALAMNAGAWGGEIWHHVAWVETLDRGGRRHRRSPSEYRIGYRQVSGPAEEWFIAAGLKLTAGDSAAIQRRMRELLQERSERQPTGVLSCGSVFRNPPGDYAARLIDQAGLKGARLGGAYVSPQHANFIINDGSATAAELEALILRVAQRVEAQFGVRLEPEVKLLGEPLPLAEAASQRESSASAAGEGR